MRYTGRKGWYATRRDVFSLNDTLRPIIAAGLKKYLEEKNHRLFGNPNILTDEEDWEVQHLHWVGILEKMLYAFDADEPSIEDYDFDFYCLNDKGERTGIFDIKANTSYTIEHTHDEEYQKYKEESKVHEDKVQEGLDLFAKYFRNLWW